MRPLGSLSAHARSDASQIIQDFVERVEAIVAFEHNKARALAREHMLEKVERWSGHGM
jgi:hypothetical protein